MRFIPKWVLNDLEKILSDFQKMETPIAEDCQSCTLYRYAVVTYNIGDFLKTGVYSRIYNNKGFYGELKITLADTMIQDIILAMNLGYDPNELIELGFKRLKEKSEVRR